MKDAIKFMESTMSQKDVEQVREEAHQEILTLRLAELREEMQIRQKEIDSFSQPSISKIEKRKDIKISTLIQYLKSLGMNLEIKAFSDNKKINKLLLKV